MALLIRSLVPSATAIVGCLGIGILCVLVHLLHHSLEYGTIAPNFLHGDFGIFYTNYVVGPLTRLFATTTYTHLGLVIVWSLCGLIAYEVLAHGIFFLRDWRQAGREASFAIGQPAVAHNLRVDLLKRSAWRFFVGITAIYLIVVFRPFISYAMRADTPLVSGKFMAAHDSWPLCYAVLIWAGLCYCLMVIARLYLFRTRLLGDETLY